MKVIKNLSGNMLQVNTVKKQKSVNNSFEPMTRLMALEPDEVLAAGKYKKVIAARSIMCYWAVRELGMSQTQLARILRISQPAVSRAVIRGGKLAKNHKFSIED